MGGSMLEKGLEMQGTCMLPPSSRGENEEHRSPRSWSPWKKRLLFFALMSSSILADGYAIYSIPYIGPFINEHRGMTWGSTLIVDQATEWGISVDKSATSMNYGMLLQGIGGLIAIPLIEAFGRCAYLFLSMCTANLMKPSNLAVAAVYHHIHGFGRHSLQQLRYIHRVSIPSRALRNCSSSSWSSNYSRHVSSYR